MCSVNIGSAVVDNWSVIEPIAWGLVAALVAYNAVALITQAINGAVALSAGVKAAAEMMSTEATFAATTAQYGLNAALLALPHYLDSGGGHRPCGGHHRPVQLDC